jgi:hypothetical protein
VMFLINLLRQLLTIDMDLYVSCSVHTSITAKLGVITSQFYGFLRLLEYDGSEYEEFYAFNFQQGNVMYISGHMQWKKPGVVTHVIQLTSLPVS